MKKFIEKIEAETKMSRGETRVKEAKEEFEKLMKEQTLVESKAVSIELHTIAKKWQFIL